LAGDKPSTLCKGGVLADQVAIENNVATRTEDRDRSSHPRGCLIAGKDVAANNCFAVMQANM
jgi:hypothetical protein